MQLELPRTVSMLLERMDSVLEDQRFVFQLCQSVGLQATALREPRKVIVRTFRLLQSTLSLLPTLRGSLLRLRLSLADTNFGSSKSSLALWTEL